MVFRDGTMRMVVFVSSINFALKNEEEQAAVIQQYVTFLNSLEFPLQIVINSRKLNIDEYLARLQKAEKEQANELLKAQISDYRQFVKELVELGEIMSKRFYVVVPFSPLSDKRKGFFARLKEAITPAITLRLKEARFKERRESLARRTEHVISNLRSIGLSAITLDTQSLIELYYSAYNPELAETEKIAEIGKLNVE